jgi:hypothetical protein
MRNRFKNLSLLLMALIAYSCNEKISPELQNGSSTTVPGGTSSEPDEYYFRVTNQSDVVLNYVLHRTGSGNAATPCSINSSTAFSSGEFSAQGNSSIDHDQKLYDYTCYFDAEELSLFYNGVIFQAEASKNTCEYITYQPFSFFEAMPGKSIGNWNVLDCGTLTDIECQTAAAGNSAVKIGASVITPGHAVDRSTNITVETSRVSVPFSDSQQLCYFDYTTNTTAVGNGKNCDVGAFTVTTHSYSKNETTGIVGVSTSQEQHSCGGSVLNCLGGPIKETKLADKYTWGRLITKVEKDKEGIVKYTLPKLIDKRDQNFDIVNFRRGLASRELDFSNYSAAGATTNWSLASPEISRFEPTLIENYSINRVVHGSNFNIVEKSDITAFINSIGQDAQPLAADPFMGINPDAILGSAVSPQPWTGYPTYRVSPFYTFSCMDKNDETKARIKIVIREWDRAFPSTTSSLELISDFGNDDGSGQELRLQDVLLTSVEVDLDPSGSPYNDYDDWDDLIPMTRSAGASSTANWRPTDGWFESILFPNQIAQ